MTDLPDPLIQNSGKEMSDFDQYQGLADVTFRIYNVTSEFYAQRAAGATVEAAKQAVQGLTPGSPIAEGITDADGNITVNVPKKQNRQRCCLRHQRRTKIWGSGCCQYGHCLPGL